MPILSEKWHILTWSRISPKFNFQHLQKISTELKMTLLTPKLGVPMELLWEHKLHENSFIKVH